MLKIFGPDLTVLEELANRAGQELDKVEGVEEVRICHLLGRVNLEFGLDRDKCARWGISASDANLVLQTALTGKSVTTMVEGEKSFDVTIRWPERLRNSEEAILNIPVDVTHNQVVLPGLPGLGPIPSGSKPDPSKPIVSTHRLRLRDLVTPLGEDGGPNPNGQFTRIGAKVVYREQGQRLIAVRFRIPKSSGAKVIAEAQQRLAPLFVAPYRAEWKSGSY